MLPTQKGEQMPFALHRTRRRSKANLDHADQRASGGVGIELLKTRANVEVTLLAMLNQTKNS